MVGGPWPVVLSVVRGRWSVVGVPGRGRGRSRGHGGRPWSQALVGGRSHGSWSVVSDRWSMIDGRWYMVVVGGLWSMIGGPWSIFMVGGYGRGRGLWSVVCGRSQWSWS
ncbi:hypothetical protein Tco_1072653 [Tanacetum coccineum]